MKTTTLLLLLAIIPVVLIAQSTDEPNVLSYYAVGNSLDGQLMIDMPNVLRFFPVFAMHQQVDSVSVTVFYGGHICTRAADCLSGKRYWQVSLPSFTLGEAIQRLEVETRIDLREFVRTRFPLVSEARQGVLKAKNSLKSKRGYLDSLLQGHDKILSDSMKPHFATFVKQSNAEFEKFGIKSVEADRLRMHLGKSSESYTAYRDSLAKTLSLDEAALVVIDRLTLERLEGFLKYMGDFRTYQDTKAYLVRSVEEAKSQEGRLDSLSAAVDDSIRILIAKEIGADLSDTLYSGPGIRKSDIIVDPDLSNAHLLYRNYKTSLRYMPALDPAERMGIFRARYVPFPIVGTQSSPRMNLKKPMSTSSPTVFEIGLAFGDAIVPGDEFVVPEFSWRRLGIAFAVTERLFSDSADVIGLALTYDFNSYGSIGIGGNFARNEVHGYASLGINKKAFEAVIGGISKLFAK
jgi:hypothetical protein